jgi:hypothetical protein
MYGEASLNGWSAPEVLGLVAIMAVTLLAAVYRESISRAIASLIYRPRVLPGEEEAERIQETREVQEWAARIFRFGLIIIAFLVWIAAIAALIDGREGPLFDALL